MRKLLVAAITATLVAGLAPAASAHAPCDHRDHTHLHFTWSGVHTDHYRYLRSESIDRHHYRDAYVVTEHGTVVRSGVCGG